MRVDLGKGQWADITPVDEVSRRVKFRVQEWSLNTLHSGEQHPGLVDMVARDMLMAYVIGEWSFGPPPAGEPDRIRDLPTWAYDKLHDETEAHWKDLDFIRQLESSSDSKTSSDSKAKPSRATSRPSGT